MQNRLNPNSVPEKPSAAQPPKQETRTPFEERLKRAAEQRAMREAQAIREAEIANGGDLTYSSLLDANPFANISNVPINVAPFSLPPMVMNQPVSPAGAGLLPPASPAEAGIQKGGIAGLLGGAINRMMDRALYSTPTFGGNFITEQAGGEVALRRMESAAAQKQQEDSLKRAKIEAELAKAGAKTKLTGPIIEQIKTYQTAVRGIDTVNKMLNLIPKGGTGGIEAKFDSFIEGLGAAVGIPTDPTNADEINKLRVSLLSAFKPLIGAQISQADYAMIEQALTSAGGLTTNPNKLISSLRTFKNRLEGDMANSAAIIRETGRRPSDFIRPDVSVTNVVKQ